MLQYAKNKGFNSTCGRRLVCTVIGLGWPPESTIDTVGGCSAVDANWEQSISSYKS